MKYPPVDSRFYEVDAAQGMTDEEIEEDWHVFIDGLNAFHDDNDKRSMENPPVPDVPHTTLKEVAKDIISKFSSNPKLEEKHAPS